jgi:hypothetical protein
VSLAAVRKNVGPYSGPCIFDWGGLLFRGLLAGGRGFTGFARRGVTTFDLLDSFLRAAIFLAISGSPMK